MTTPADNAPKKQRGRPFQRGRSGNPAGKAKGTRNRATMACEALLDGQTEQLTQKAIDLALKGDVQALRICMDRIAPPRRDRPVVFELPKVEAAADHPVALAAIMAAVASGDLTPTEGQSLAAMLAEHRKALETADIETRLAALEANNGR
ncbi:DUF5681 domain-containing protein [Novosphingobium sp. EMRT-2]|uniref:DUF5681 domain-containing protein n=1 Tax=Novosphingobium sp. EMRT-2 TaxID=2571749 RepID=UPI0010BD8785|nr:DUF5681 domain-containing protein [Novosphingobium sp. EMRT-2]QCI92120.1 hypothetical protein FA702_00070 [Novosphingobium sp. EMRT-2]QCI95158.1 hypothetical protein FA702_17695 [Novosphingobium sp. EMRT-2]